MFSQLGHASGSDHTSQIQIYITRAFEHRSDVHDLSSNHTSLKVVATITFSTIRLLIYTCRFFCLVLDALFLVILFQFTIGQIMDAYYLSGGTIAHNDYILRKDIYPVHSLITPTICTFHSVASYHTYLSPHYNSCRRLFTLLHHKATIVEGKRRCNGL